MEHDNTALQIPQAEKKSLRCDTIEHHIFDDDEHFTTIYNQSLQNIRDPIAHAIYHYLRSLPKDWKVIPKQVANHFGLNVQTVRKKLKVLIELRYMFYGQTKEKGKFGSGIYYLFRKPLSDERFQDFQKKFPKTKKPCAVSSNTVEAHNTKDIDIQKKKETTTETKESSAAPPDSSLFSSNKPWIKKVRKEAPEEVEAFISYAKAHMHEAEILEKWLMACATKQYWKTAAPSPEEKKEKHEKIAKWIVKNYPSADIVIGYNYLEFLNGVNSEPVHLKFGDKSFEERCKKELKRRGLDLLFQA